MKGWPGRYRLVFSDELRAWYRTRIGATLDPEKVAAALLEAETEASSAEVWLSADFSISSRSGRHEFYSTSFSLAGDTARFTKPPGIAVELQLTDAGIVAREPGKPNMHFRRLTED